MCRRRARSQEPRLCAHPDRHSARRARSGRAVERVASLLAETERVEALMSSWMEDVLSSMRSIEARRRLEPCRTTAFVDSVL